MQLKIRLKGKPVLTRILQILALSNGWKLTPKELEVAVELFYRNYELILDGVKDEEVRMNNIFSKENKNKLAKSINSSYNVVANSITSLRGIFLGDTPLVFNNKLHKNIQKIDFNNENLELKIIFNPNEQK